MEIMWLVYDKFNQSNQAFMSSHCIKDIILMHSLEAAVNLHYPSAADFGSKWS